MKRGWLAGALLTFAVAGCGSDDPPVVSSFAPLHYEYLPKLRLNVGRIEVVDRSLPVNPQDIASSSPVVPAQTLAQMARDRLFAAGNSGTATFTVDQASIVREPNGTLEGQLAAHLDLATPDGGRTGYAEARVARQHTPGSEAEDGSANLYALTRQMMDAMNVELEYQIRRSLRAFVVNGAGTPTPVAAQPLEGAAAQPLGSAAAQPPEGAGIPPPVPPPPALPPAVPDAPPADAYQDPAALPPQQMSPPPGYLQPPPGALPTSNGNVQ